MKLVICGSTDFVGTELVRQALVHPAINSVVALSRQKSIVHCQLRASRTIAVTPVKLHSLPFDEVCKISRDYAMTAIQALASSSSSSLASSPAIPRESNDNNEPFRFMYISGIAAKRDRAEAEKDKLLVEGGMVEYCLVRGDAESQILTFAETSHGKVEASVARPGLILGPEDQERRVTSTFPSMEVDELAAALLDQVTKGFEKTMLLHDDLVRLGQHAVTRNR